MAVDDRRQVKPALPCRNVGDVADHFLARSHGGEISFHVVRDVVLLAVALGQADPPGRGWQGSRPRSRMMDRTSSGPAGTPQAARSAWTRRYPYVPSDSSNDFRTINASISRLLAVAGRRGSGDAGVRRRCLPRKRSPNSGVCVPGDLNPHVSEGRHHQIANASRPLSSLWMRSAVRGERSEPDRQCRQHDRPIPGPAEHRRAGPRLWRPWSQLSKVTSTRGLRATQTEGS